MTIPKIVREYAKTIAAFVAGVVISVITNLVNGSTPWPSNLKEAGQLILMSFGSAIVVAGTRNKITQAQIDKDPNVVGTVFPEPVAPTPEVPQAVDEPVDGQSPWRE